MNIQSKIIIFTSVFVGLFLFISFTNAEQTPPQQTLGELTIQEDSFYRVVLPGLASNNEQEGKEFYGKIRVLFDNYIQLSSVYYRQFSDDGSQETLVALGDELHRPEPVLFIRLSSIDKVGLLSEDHPILAAMNKYPKPTQHQPTDGFSVDQLIKKDSLQALFFDDESFVFTKLIPNSATRIAFDVDRVWQLVEISDQPGTLVPRHLKPQEAQQILRKNLLYWQNLDTSSPIITQIQATGI